MESEAERRAGTYRGEVLDRLNKYRAPGFLVSLRLHGKPTKQVPCRQYRLEHELRVWLRSLNQSASWLVRTQKPGHVERFSWPDFRKVDPKAGIEVHLTIEAQPCEPPKRYDLGCFAAAMTLDEAFIPRPDIPIADAIAEKATPYGDLDLPYIIAVNVPDGFADGDEVRRGIEAGFKKAGRRARTIVSGVLLANVPNISAAVDLVPVLYVNPAARHPLAEHVKYFHPFQGNVRVRRPRP